MNGISLCPLYFSIRKVRDLCTTITFLENVLVVCGPRGKAGFFPLKVDNLYEEGSRSSRRK